MDTNYNQFSNVSLIETKILSPELINYLTWELNINNLGELFSWYTKVDRSKISFTNSWHLQELFRLIKLLEIKYLGANINPKILVDNFINAQEELDYDLETGFLSLYCQLEESLKNLGCSLSLSNKIISFLKNSYSNNENLQLIDIIYDIYYNEKLSVKLNSAELAQLEIIIEYCNKHNIKKYNDLQKLTHELRVLQEIQNKTELQLLRTEYKILMLSNDSAENLSFDR